jgi:ribosomal protein S19
MSRSLKKGPYTNPKLLEKVAKAKVGDKIGTDVPAIINALLTVDVQDLAGTHLFYALP